MRQLTNKALDILRTVLLQQNSTSRPYRVDPQLLVVLADVLERIQTLATPGMLERELRTTVLTEFGLTEQQFDSVDDLLYAFAGLQRVQMHSTMLEPIVHIESVPFSFDVVVAVRTVHDVFASRAVGLQDIDLLIEVNKRLKKGSRLNLEQLRTAVRLCSTVESLADKTLRCRFAFLDTRAEQIERILIEHGRPMPVEEIVRSMNHRLAQADNKTVNERNVANLLVSDPRFTPIGRSGEWKLTIWEHETAPIAALMRQYLMLRNEPANAEEITQYVQGRRTASESSVASYLSFDKSFVEITRGHWGLAEWREARETQNWNPDQVAQFVESYFKERRVKRVEYALLKSALMERTGMSAKQVQGLLAHNPAVVTQLVGGQRIAEFQPDYKQKLAAGPIKFPRKKKTLVQSIGEDVQEALERAPTHAILQAEAIDMLIAKYGNHHKRPYNMFHSYLSRLDFIERFTPADSNKVWLRLKQR